MRKPAYAAVAALAAFLACSTAANAVSMQLTFSGIVSSDPNFPLFDATNTFGTGGNLLGQAVSMSFLYSANPGDTYLSGVAPSPIRSMSLTINGKTFVTEKGTNYVGDFGAGGYFLRNDIYSVLSAWGDVTYSTPYSAFNRTGFYSTIFGTFFAADLVTPFNVSGFNCPGCGSFVAYRVLAGGSDYFMGRFDITSASASVVPLPAALPLFVAALAGLGGAAVRRRRKAA